MPKHVDSSLAWTETQFGLDANDYSTGLFFATIASRGYTHMRSRQLSIGKVKPDEFLSLLGDVSFCSRGEVRLKALIDRPGVLVSFELRVDFARVTAAGEDAQLLDSTVDALVAMLPKRKSSEVSTPIAIWSEHRETGTMALRDLQPEPWRDLADGYPTAVRSDLESLMSLRSAPSGGRLILWHGEPGNGQDPRVEGPRARVAGLVLGPFHR